MQQEAIADRKSAANYNKTHLIVLCLALAVVTAAAYLQVANCPFLSYDDYDYVTGNPRVARGISGRNLLWAFTAYHASNWHPITWISHMADVQLFGLNPAAHHLTSLAIHIASSLLLLLLLVRVTGSLWSSSLVAALFALHPLHVESVAWVAERKDVLSAFFFFLTLLLYARWTKEQTRGSYLGTLVSFLIGLMCKPMLVTLPVVMLLFDFWPLGRLRQGEDGSEALRLADLLKEKVPFFVCTLLSCLVTIYAQSKGGAVKTLTGFSLGDRLQNALTAYVKYIVKLGYPHDLAIIYPFPSAFPLWQTAGALLLLVAVSVAVVSNGKRHPYLAAGWFWFLVTLVPVIGIVQVGEQSMADRYSYIPSVGLFIMIAWGISALSRGWRYRTVTLSVLAVVALATSTVLTWRQLRYWQDGIALFSHAVETTTGNYTAHYSLAHALSSAGRPLDAMFEYREVLRLKPDLYEAHNNLGYLLAKNGDLDGAVAELREARRLEPTLPETHDRLGFVLASRGAIDEAIAEFSEALRLQPDYEPAHRDLGFALLNKGLYDAAIAEFQEALRLDPDGVEEQEGLKLALLQKQRAGR